MINKNILATVVAAALTLPTATLAADSSWYVGISINAVDVDNIDSASTTNVAGVTRNLSLGSDSDTGYGIKIGKTLFTSGNGNSLSIELNYQDLSADIDDLVFQGNQFSNDANTAEGEVEIESILFRATYQVELGLIDPYVSIGLGSTDLDVDARYGGSIGSAPQTQPPFASDGSSEFSYQFRLGAEYDVTENFGLFLEYARTEADDVSFQRLGGGPGGLATTIQETDLEFDSVNFGINYHF